METSQILHRIIDFFTNESRPLWQDILVNSITIPVAIFLFRALAKWYVAHLPIKLLFKNCINTNEVLIFLSQFSGATETFQKNPNQKLVVEYPSPTPQNRNNIASNYFHNINPLWSESDGRCATDIFNTLGRAGKTENVRLGTLIKDWEKRNIPIFSIGGNPKTHDLLNECYPINFQGLSNPFVLKIDGHSIEIRGHMPIDGGVIQKTFFKGSDIPVFILAGLGTIGTEITGRFFSSHFTDLGKLYGKNSFCILLGTDTTKGETYYDVKAMYPNPKFKQIFAYPFTFLKWNRRGVFPKGK